MLNWIMKPALSITTRSSLLSRLKNAEDEEGWREFNRIYREFVRRLALRARLTDEEAEDVVQEVLVSVARHIGGFKYEPEVSSFKRWLSNVVRWRISDERKRHFRYRRIFPQSADEPGQQDVIQRIPDPASFTAAEAWEEEWGKSMVSAALERVKNQVQAKHYQIYYLHVLNERPVAEVCRRLKVNRGQVYLAKHRVGRLVEKELRSLRKQQQCP